MMSRNWLSTRRRSSWRSLKDRSQTMFRWQAISETCTTVKQASHLDLAILARPKRLNQSTWPRSLWIWFTKMSTKQWIMIQPMKKDLDSPSTLDHLQRTLAMMNKTFLRLPEHTRKRTLTKISQLESKLKVMYLLASETTKVQWNRRKKNDQRLHVTSMWRTKTIPTACWHQITTRNDSKLQQGTRLKPRQLILTLTGREEIRHSTLSTTSSSTTPTMMSRRKKRSKNTSSS